MKYVALLRLFWVLVAIAGLTGCGGSGGANPEPPTSQPTPPPLSTNANLGNLIVSAVELDQVFDPEVASYTGNVNFLVSSTTVTATTSDAGASLLINNKPATSGSDSAPVALNPGNNTISISVTAEDGVTTRDYSVDITRATAAQYGQRAYIKASNTEANDNFGSAVSLSGDTLVVGARYESSDANGVDGEQSDNSALQSGAVYIFVRDPAGVWRQQAYLKASNSDTSDKFGIDVSLDGDTLAVGAESEGSSATGIDGEQNNNDFPGSGAVYIFTRDSTGAWNQQAYIKPPVSVGTAMNFGSSVSLSGDTLAVGAKNESTSNTGVNSDPAANPSLAGKSGAVFIFDRDANGEWSQSAYLKASNTGTSDQFGWSVSLSGDDLAVGANQEYGSSTGVNGDQSDNGANDSGAVYLFRRSTGGDWSQTDYLKASNTESNDLFGHSVAISGDLLAVGATGEDSDATGVGGDQTNNNLRGTGAVYVFQRDESGDWSQAAYVKSIDAGAGSFGSALAFTGNTLIVGATLDNSMAANSGAAYVYAKDETGAWTGQTRFKASNPELNDRFGEWLAVSDDTVAVGAYGEDSAATGTGGNQADNTAAQSGAVYVFQ